jgi:hypothetical protein
LNQANHKQCHHISILCKNILEKDSEKAEIFRKIEPYLTFPNIRQLQRQGVDIQTKIEELKELDQSLRQREKVKDDAIVQLPDQLVSLSARLQKIILDHHFAVA